MQRNCLSKSTAALPSAASSSSAVLSPWRADCLSAALELLPAPLAMTPPRKTQNLFHFITNRSHEVEV